MSSQYAAEICALLVEDNFGELFECIFSTLQRYNRLDFPRLKKYSDLPAGQLLHGLAAMTQHRLVFHYTNYDDGVTYYEANRQSAYYLARSGKILELVKDRLGDYAAAVMSAIMFFGYVQVSHLETLPELTVERPAPNGVAQENGEYEEPGEQEDQEDQGEEEEGQEGQEEQEEQEAEVNGVNGDHTSEKPAPLHSTLKNLAAHGYIIRVREAHFQSHNDNVLDAERTVKSRPHLKQLKGKKYDEAVIEGTVNLIKERTDADLSRGLTVGGVPRGAKRKHETGDSSPRKKARMDYAAVDEDGDDDEEENEWSDDEMGGGGIPMQPGLVIQVNYDKLDVALRNRRIAELAEQSSSPATADIYECLLRRIEYQTAQCRDSVEIPREGEEGEQYSVPIPLNSIVNDVDPGLDVAGSIAPKDNSQPFIRRGKRPLDDDDGGVNGTNGAESGANRTYEIDQHLSLLAQPPLGLTSKRTLSGMITWTVEFRHLARKLRHLELERMIESRYGDVALRVIRVLHAKGKLDEKRLQEISLLPFKDLRQVLAVMQTAGFVDLQEVPRDALRQPSRTIYLWFYDVDRICSTVLEDTYKSMSRCLQRLRFERSRLKDFLEKTERSDVKGNEERYLTEGEIQSLQQWRAKEALLLGEMARLDDMVAVMRDY